METDNVRTLRRITKNTLRDPIGSDEVRRQIREWVHVKESVNEWRSNQDTDGQIIISGHKKYRTIS